MGIDGNGKSVTVGYAWITRDLTSVNEGINGPLTVPGGRYQNGGGDFGAGNANRHGELYRDAGFSSYHSGGANFAMCDGSVHFFIGNIDQSTLDAMASREQGDIVGDVF